MSGGEKVLVVGPSWVGDMVMAQALYRLLVQRSPGAEIDVVAPSWSLPVLARMSEVANGIELGVGHGELALRVRRALGVSLRGGRYARALVLPRSAKAALVPWFARVPRRTGFRGEWRYGLLNDVRRLDARLDQTVKRFVALGQEPDEEPFAELPTELTPRLLVDRANLERLRRDLELRSGATVTLMPGAEYGPAKRWPAAHYAALAAALAKDGIDVLVLGSAKERELGAQVCTLAATPRAHNLCGRTTLADVIDLIGAADVAVTNDSGLLHVAAATGTHVVAIYGSSSPRFTPPLTGAKTVLYLALECSPCFARECPLGHLRCLHGMTADSVLAAVRSALGAPRAAAAELVRGRPDA